MNLSKVRRDQMSPQLLMHEFLTSYTFVDIGNVNAVSEDKNRVDVLLPYKNPDNSDLLIEGVEVLRQGTRKVSISVSPKVGDSVLVFCPRHLLSTTENNHKNEVAPAGYYNQAGMKALLVQGTLSDEPDVTITIDEEQVAVITKQPIALNSDDSVTINGHLKVKA